MRQSDFFAGAWRLIFMILAVIAGTAAPAVAADENTIKIRDVRFVGVRSISQKDLAGSIQAGVPPFWKFWESHPVMHTDDLEDDLLRIRQYYQSEGFYETAVSYTLIPKHPEKAPSESDSLPETDAGPGPLENDPSARNSHPPEVIVEFHITEGLPVIVRDIVVECLCTLETMTADQIRHGIPLQAGRIFRTSEYEKAKTTIKKLLGNKAYPFAEVEGSALVDLNDHSAVITLHIEPGELFYFGEVRISGHEGYVREKIIRRAVTVQPGEKYSDAALDASRRNLFDLNVFKSAAVHTGEPVYENNTVPVDVQVTPREKRSVKLGLGYGTDDGVRLQAAWTYRNLTQRADRLTFQARRSDILENIYGEYLVPYFLSAENNLVVTGGFKREEKDYYTLNSTSAEAGFYRKLDMIWFSTFGYNLEVNRPEDVRTQDADGLTDPRDTENYLVSSVKFQLERNSVDNLLNARNGSMIRFSLEHASDYIGSEINYLQPGISGRMFVPLPQNIVLAGRVGFTTIRKTGNTEYIPISKQFFSGGSKSVRGYGFEKLGVVNKHDVIESVSGLSSFLANLELRFPVYRDFRGVVFLDAGALNNDAFAVDLDSLRYTTGLGLRYNTVIGPLQLDFGYQLNPAKSVAADDPLLIDLLEKDRWYIHFNIGQSF